MASPLDKLSEAMTPSQVVAVFQSRGIEISERTLRERARRIGAYRLIGKAMFFLPDDLDALIESSKPKLKVQPTSGTWTEKDTDALIARLEGGTKKGRRTK